MQPITFCNRCRGMQVGYNRRYIFHCLICRHWLLQSSKFLIAMMFASVLVLAFSTPTALVFSGQNAEETIQEATVEAAEIIPEDDPATLTIEGFLEKYKVDEGQRDRIASAIVSSFMVSMENTVRPCLAPSLPL